MAIDDRVAASLPAPPRPAPARRAAAIDRALRRFDGASEPEQDAPAALSPARQPLWRRPYAGALVGVTLAVLIGMPVVWNSMQERGASVSGGPSADTQVQGESSPPALEYTDASILAAEPPPAPPQVRIAPAFEAGPAVEAVRSAAPTPASKAPPLPQAYAAARAEKARAPDPGRSETADAVSEDAIVPAGARNALAQAQESLARIPRVSLARVRGDWNACTVDDPRRDMSACHATTVAAAARMSEAAKPQLEDGLALAWQGDLDDAIAAFDRAIAAQPGSAPAYLNRGMVYRRKGDLDRALADLDRAVRHAPRAARGYYNRSVVLRQMGAVDRARTDEQRAVALDPRYRAIVP